MAPDRVRLRLTAGAAAVTLAVLLVAAGGLVWAFARAQSGAADDVARARLSELAARAERGQVPRLLTDVGDDGFAQVVVDGEVLGASANLGDSSPVSAWRPGPGTTAVRDLARVPDDDETEDYRTWATTVRGPDGPVTAYVGTAHEVVAESVRRLGLSLAAGLPLLLVVATGLVWLLVGRVLRPVEEGHRRQREFVADAAHELQSPLTSYRTQLEVAARVADPDTCRATVRDLLAESDRMERLVRDLLFLARDDQPPSPPDSLLDLDDVVAEEVARIRPVTDVAIDATGVAAAPVRGHRGDLGRLVRNLLANAARHAAGRVEVACGVEPGGRGPARGGRRRPGSRPGGPRPGLRAVLARRRRPQRHRQQRAGPLDRAGDRRAARRQRPGRRPACRPAGWPAWWGAGGGPVRGAAARCVRRRGE